MTDLQQKQVKMTKAQWDFLGKLGKELGDHDGRGDHSKLVREIISAAATKWLESPYVCLLDKHMVLVTGMGDVFYRQEQVLRLNKKRERLPCSLEIKPEKKKDYLEACPDKDEASWFKSRWLLNYFAAWHSRSAGRGLLLDSFVDHDGTDNKTADLLIDLGPGSVVTREIVVGLDEFVQWRGAKRGDDRVGIPIDIPTRNLEVVVIVDMDLYRNSPLNRDEIPDLQLEFRNPENARFEGEGIARDRWNPLDDPIVGRCTGKRSEPNTTEMRKYLRELDSRIQFLATQTAANGEVVPPEQRSRLLKATQLPKSFLYYKLRWPSPYFGVEVCIRWEKAISVR
ncbi:MAG TPA: hypothetical protein VN493_04640 [Thermoanaerobaculia bacterium]|nr:hypothetical protein [Thermoanaerobaculia bacterium]